LQPLLWLLAAKKKQLQLLHQHPWLHQLQRLHQLLLTPQPPLLHLQLLLPHLLLPALWTLLATLPKKQLTQLKTP
jgi:replication fork clamp-binding protein CrfC